MNMYVVLHMTWATLARAEFGSGPARIVGLAWSSGHVGDEMVVFTWPSGRDM